MRSRLASDPAVTVASVNRAVTSCRESGLGNGAIVNRIRDLAAGDTTTMPKRQTPEQASRNRTAARTALYGSVLDWLSPTDLDRLPEKWRAVAGLVEDDPLNGKLTGLSSDADALLKLANSEVATAA